MKALDRKLERIRAGSYTPRDFIVADAKDADMAGARAAFGAHLQEDLAITDPVLAGEGG